MIVKRLSYCRMLAPPLLLALSLPQISPTIANVLVGVAASLHLLSRTEKQFGRIVMAAVVLIITSVWLPLPVACFLGGIYMVEALFADSWYLRTTRIAAAVLCMSVIVFTLNGRIGLQTTMLNYSLFAFVMALVAILPYQRQRTVVDPFMCTLLSLLLLCFALSVKVLAITLADYHLALALGSVVYCAALAVVIILITPALHREGGLQFFSQAFAMEVPLERWITEISEIADDKKKPEDFLLTAAQHIMTLPGIIGVGWQTEQHADGHIGQTLQPIHINCPPIRFSLSRRRYISPWTWFNYYLLCRVVSEYYLSKRREQEQQAQSLLQAAHQAGARITHDIKNILHILSALSLTKDESVVRRQLPLLHHRLQIALNKLHQPQTEAAMETAHTWWDDAKARHAHTAVIFRETTVDATIPSLLFDRALDNFLENALSKYASSPLTVEASLRQSDNGIELQVSDDGIAIAETISQQLFLHPVSSEGGLGIALYQLAKEAEGYGYRTVLSCNREGRVVFVLQQTQAVDSRG